ncbi:hypothetical protein Peur_039067 [Populus x canadensis]
MALAECESMIQIKQPSRLLEAQTISSLPLAFLMKTFRLSVGKEVKPGDAAAQFVLTAMKNIYNSIASANLNIKSRRSIETSYLFAVFDENQKGGAETGRHCGSFSPINSPSSCIKRDDKSMHY